VPQGLNTEKINQQVERLPSLLVEQRGLCRQFDFYVVVTKGVRVAAIESPRVAVGQDPPSRAAASVGILEVELNLEYRVAQVEFLGLAREFLTPTLSFHDAATDLEGVKFSTFVNEGLGFGKVFLILE